MRLITFDLLTNEPRDVERLLHQLTEEGDPLITAKVNLLLALVRRLREYSPEGEAACELLGDELVFTPARSGRGPLARVAIDWPDRGPLDTAGMPRLHYRVNVTRPGQALSIDTRSQDVETIARVIVEVCSA